MTLRAAAASTSRSWAPCSAPPLPLRSCPGAPVGCANPAGIVAGGLRWWAVALGLPLAYFSAWHVGLLLVGNDAVDVSLRTTKAVSYVPLVLALSLVGGGLNEEPGWRGFALPRLPPARRSRLRREWPREPHGSSRHLTSWRPQESDAKADQGDGQQDGSGPGQPGSRRSSLFRSDQHVHEESP